MRQRAQYVRNGERCQERTVVRRRKEAFPWGNEDTEQLIEILGKYKVKATFFLVGQWVDKYPESVKALSDAGQRSKIIPTPTLTCLSAAARPS